MKAIMLGSSFSLFSTGLFALALLGHFTTGHALEMVSLGCLLIARSCSNYAGLFALGFTIWWIGALGFLPSSLDAFGLEIGSLASLSWYCLLLSLGSILVGIFNLSAQLLCHFFNSFSAVGAESIHQERLSANQTHRCLQAPYTQPYTGPYTRHSLLAGSVAFTPAGFRPQQTSLMTNQTAFLTFDSSARSYGRQNTESKLSELVASLRKEPIELRKVDMVVKLFRIMRALDKEAVVPTSSVQNSTYVFGHMQRSYIPKANKPGKLRPITKANDKDIVLMKALSILLGSAYEEEFRPSSHGFRTEHGHISYFRSLEDWGRLDLFVKADVVSCFDRIPHAPLVRVIDSFLGEENRAITNLLSAFVKTKIVDKAGNDYSSETIGIPQGSPLSPVLMNLYLHQVDVKIESFMKSEGDSIRYARYADDMMFGIVRGKEEVEGRFLAYIERSLNELGLEITSEIFYRGRSPCESLVLGLLVKMNPEGELEIRAPFKRWETKFGFDRLLAQTPRDPDSKQATYILFAETVMERIKGFLSFSFCCKANQRDVVAFFRNILRARLKDYRVRFPAEKVASEVSLTKVNDWYRYYRSAKRNGARKGNRPPKMDLHTQGNRPEERTREVVLSKVE